MELRRREFVLIESPLNSDERQFLLSFENSSEERVLADRCLSKDQALVRRAVKEEEDNKISLRTTLASHWADARRLERHTRNRFQWWHVAYGGRKGGRGPTRTDGRPVKPPAWDHPSLWVRDGAPVVAVSQPYPWLLNEHIDQLNDFARDHELSFRISNSPAWHYPGSCWFIEWYSVYPPHY